MTRIIIAIFALSAVCVYADIFPHGYHSPCAASEVFAHCGKTGERSCELLDNTPIELNPKMCRMECRCKDGLYRNKATGACLTKEACKQKSLRYV